ncbi:type I-E CRISPR-associated protein Cas5/CasD [Rathayibacter toxicus]|uniref:Type I-E CRISPR-associated protein Cas5/CasD n=2 Tax=Rathayibacter toxicus TaxID=145458 RepID=A0A2S5Y9R4_9MICO|nr:type I-E CRISPR-associated protein Cas5/CasD [Rathayibacter toxicus]PPG24725.1 type I-E CRISPR-associated protein Cas5/CasD [Rathayibacter toxicus]PPG48179.1 type I-E CRISPR-associated protein Cas5/CasD [Rathayibacter toxicus]PPH25480.1 type I-E CRISPR-associated protein Cas5/CasD [Rathayibacter toxicus]PPH59183.1 type I-E CRISPR-associated protein Cas5/CasD [Rathayibacter toxicus]PPH61292.1 type I-E CRISPR-associated protein Cas5/CasD [Rathayibacter toxicus]
MTVLMLQLAGPLQSWGTSSRYARRDSGREPSKSGIIGMIAAAQGRRRTDPIEDLVGLKIGVRSDQPGHLIRDYQTARHPLWKNAALSTRYYLSDAVFLAAIEAEISLLEGIDKSVKSPQFPLYLGRRSCPPSRPVSFGLRDGTLADALEKEPWIASEWCKRRARTPTARLLISIDGSNASSISVRDIPVSFNEERREYLWRDVISYETEVDNEFVSSISVPRRFGDLDSWSAVEV